MAAWKKKERPLTPEEAIALAKKDLAPFWYNSEPLLAALRTETGASVLPLNSNFVQQAWTYAFIDPTEFAGERALLIIREWHRRYGQHKMGFIIVFKAAAPFAKSAPDFMRRFGVQMPAMYDQDNLFSAAFGIQSWPAVVVQYGTQEIARGSGANWNEDAEEKVQVFLRKFDLGLSLPLAYELPHPVVGKSRTDFGAVKGKPVAALKDVIQLSGNWKEGEDCITTSDPTATAVIISSTPVVALIAQAGVEGQLTKILIESVDGAMVQDWVAEPATIDENGHEVVRIQHFGLYYALKDLPANRRKFRLLFPDADTVPVLLYGIRFGAKV